MSRFAMGQNVPVMMREAVDFVLRLQQREFRDGEEAGNRGELLNWITAMRGMGLQDTVSLRDQPGARRSLTALAKLAGDQQRMAEAFEAWLADRGTAPG